MSQLGQIVEGHVKEALGIKNEKIETRLKICHSCPLCTQSTIGFRCNKNLYINPKTDEVSSEPKPGFIRGCGCRIDAKVRCDDCECVAGKW